MIDMENFLDKLFNLTKIPTQLVFVLWLSASLVLFVPERFLIRLNLNDFLEDYGKYLGIIFIICSAFLLVALINNIKNAIDRHRIITDAKHIILQSVICFNVHEKALLREFFIQNKDTLQLPFDNDTVVGLVNKHILYQASDIGFTYTYGPRFPYSITKFARKKLTNEMIDLPRNPTEEDKRMLIKNRPSWVK
jgi:hypothetical protein